MTRTLISLLATVLMTNLGVSAPGIKPGDTEVAPPGKRFTVVTFGDSTTALRAHVVVYTTQLEQRLAGAPVRFVNRGVGGNTTVLARARFEKDVLSEKPDLVIIQFGLNDLMIDVWKTPPATKPRVPVDVYENNLRYFVTAIRATGGKAILMTPNQIRWSPILRKLYSHPPYDPNDEKGLMVGMGPYVDAVRRVARDLDVPLVDVYALYDAWEKRTGQSCSQLMLDGEHPNTAGHAMEADALEPLVRAALALPPAPKS